jgi:hypothetical protein
MSRYEPTEKFRLSLYLLPVFGVFPAIWTLTRPNASLDRQRISRTSFNLALAWSIVYFSCWEGASLTGEIASLRLLYANALVTTGYFGLCFWLTLRIWQGRSINIFREYTKDT